MIENAEGIGEESIEKPQTTLGDEERRGKMSRDGQAWVVFWCTSR